MGCGSVAVRCADGREATATAARSTGCSSTRRAAASGRCSRGLTSAGGRAAGEIDELVAQAGGAAGAPARPRRAPGGALVYSVCTISAEAEGDRRFRRANSCAAIAGVPLSSTRLQLTAAPSTAPTASSSRACAAYLSAAPRYARRSVAEARDQARTGVPRLRGAVAAADGGAGPLPLRLLPAPLRARVGVPELRRALDDRADVEHGDRRRATTARAACCGPSEMTADRPRRC